MKLPVRPEFAGQRPYGAPQLNVPVALNVNENPFPPHPRLIAAITAACERASRQLNRYPDREARRLRSALSDYLAADTGVTLHRGEIWAANGSNEIMSQILTAFAGPGRTVMSFTPSYSMYREYTRNVYSTWCEVPRRADYTLDLAAIEERMVEARPAVILISSPNNPTGTALQREELDAILTLAAQHGPEPESPAMVVVDEAYGEFRRDGVSSAVELISSCSHLIVTRTMSKAFGAAGLRLGYMAARPEVIDVIRVVRLPYHLSALTQAAACAVLEHRDPLMEQIAVLRRERDRLTGRMRSLGLNVPQSDANFVLFGSFADRHDVWQQLLERGVLIREVGPTGYLRASIGTPQENDVFLQALEEVIG
ncbi:histidinol-phosphate transaminase [Trueperella sp. LYQ143]|uniref:histidinol-phosphate transaminase n=1 Tax=unclassified Trueperella TaxID=2630174 RepID=UPI003982E121